MERQITSLFLPQKLFLLTFAVLPPATLTSSQLEVSELYSQESPPVNSRRIFWFAVLMLSYRDDVGIGFGKCLLFLQALIWSQASHHRWYFQKSPRNFGAQLK